MNKIFYLILFLLLSIKIVPNRVDLSTNRLVPATLMGEVKFPSNCKANGFCLYFNGACVSVEDGTYIFKSPTESINILVIDSDGLDKQLDENNLVTLTLKKGFCYYFYNLNKRRDLNGFSWDIRAAYLPVFRQTKIVPLNTLIVPISIDYVDKELENVVFKFGNRSTKLPAVKIKDGKAVPQEIAKSCMAFLDLKPFHSKQKTQEARSDNLKVSMFVE